MTKIQKILIITPIILLVLGGLGLGGYYYYLTIRPTEEKSKTNTDNKTKVKTVISTEATPVPTTKLVAPPADTINQTGATASMAVPAPPKAPTPPK